VVWAVVARRAIVVVAETPTVAPGTGDTGLAFALAVYLGSPGLFARAGLVGGA
jgi:hypothetical protein